MSDQSEKLYEFGGFSFDAREKILRRGDEEFSLPPKVMDVLCLLVEREGKIVSKSELMEAVWADSFVEESNLTQSIYTVRRVLGTDENGKNFIETVPRRGYRIAVPIQRIEEEEKGKTRAATIETDISQLVFDEKSPGKSVEPEKKAFSFFRLFAASLKISIPLALILFIGFIAAYFYLSKAAPVAPIENVVFQRLTFSGDVAFPVISPDGKSLAFVRGNNIFLQDIGTGSNFKLNITDHKFFGNLQFSADGENIYFRDEDRTDAAGDIFRVSRFGGMAQMIAENVWSGVGFSPAGKHLAFVRFYPNQSEWALIVKNLDSGEERKLLSRNLPFTIYRSGYPAWSADGRKITVVEQTPDQKNISKLLIIDAETAKAEMIETSRFVQIEQTAWLPSGKGLLVVGRENNHFFQLWKITYPGGELQRITNDLNIYRNISLSADGKNLLARQQSIYSHIWTVSADDLQNQKQVTFGNLNRDGNAGLAWTADGNIVYASRITGNIDIWSVRPDDGFRRQLTENSGNANENPFASADGKFVYFESTRSGSRHIWRVEAGGENPAQITFSDKETEHYPKVSPDGNFLYYLQKSAKTNAVWRKNLTNGQTEMLTEQSKVSPDTFLSISPDGAFLAFNNLTGKSKENAGAQTLQIGMISTQGSGAARFFNISATSPKIIWTADGKAFDYLENSADEAKIRRQNIDPATEPKLLLIIPKATIFDFAWSADGGKLALARGKQETDVILLRNFE